MSDCTQSLANMTKEQILERNIKVFMRLYKDVLIKRCRIKIQEIRDDGTYVIVTYGQPAFERDKRNFVSPITRRYFLTPWGSYFKQL